MSAAFDPFAGHGPRWFAIPSYRPFLEDLAAGVLQWLGDAPPETLSDAVILLPNRRAARAFGAALAKQAGDRPVLLPQVRPLGDLEEDEPPFSPGDLGLDLPPAIAPLTRRFEMARMIGQEFSGLFEREMTVPYALELADALGGFIDSCQIEEIEDIGRVTDLVQGDLALHWEKSATFLAAAVEAWPKRLAELGLVDPAWRRAKLLRLLAERWNTNPPTGPVIAAGSTGSAPAAAAVLGAVARAPMGCVVLPGLDQALNDEVWKSIGGGPDPEEQHPQSILWRLLNSNNMLREGVHRWPAVARSYETNAVGQARQRLINEALRPADATADWRAEIEAMRQDAQGTGATDPIALGIEGLSLVTTRTEEDAASTIALMMRQALETPDQTCALVTPDLALGRRVEARLLRWGIVADSSAGLPLSRTSAGVLIDLCARWLVDPLMPQTILALLKHTLVSGRIAGDLATATLERHALRDAKPLSWTSLQARLDARVQPRESRDPPSDFTRAKIADAKALAARLETLVAASAIEIETGDLSVALAATRLTELIEALAGQNAWAGPDGEEAARVMTSLIEGGGPLFVASARDLHLIVAGLLKEAVVRTGGATHPRLRILGAIEARLARADTMILAGLEEGVWPNAAPTDPFLSRPMRKALGLPPPERRLGQTAQDFVQAACADRVVMIHTGRRGGQPSVKSRWLWRLEMLIKGANSDKTPLVLDTEPPGAGLADVLDRPQAGKSGLESRPDPRPPVSRRPRNLPVTSIERWVRDPYAIYAARILGLKKLDRPGEGAQAMKRGTAVHNAIEAVIGQHLHDLPYNMETLLAEAIEKELVAAGFDEAAMARERLLARGMAHWLAKWEVERRQRGATLLIEQSGEMKFDAPFAPFTVTAKADRIELDSYGAAIIDFKTGAPPSAKEVAAGYSPQLTLTGAILESGGFAPDAPPVMPTELLYVQLKGRKDSGKMVDVSKGEAQTLSEQALQDLTTYVERFDDAQTPYVSWAAPQMMGTFGGNYDHLARVWEWHVVGGEDVDSE